MQHKRLQGLWNYNKSAVNYFPLHIHLMWIASSSAHRNDKNLRKTQQNPGFFEPCNDMLNRCDFRCVFTVENVRDRRRSTGRLFQARGRATARARSPMVEPAGRAARTRTSAVPYSSNRVIGRLAGRWWVDCYIWYGKEGPGRAAAVY